jgi:hypothetical protein
MATLGFLSNRVKKKPQIGLTSDRYEFLGLDQAEPDLGDPIIGPSSIGANPVPLNGYKYVLVANGNNTGKRYWMPSESLSDGLIPGSFSVYDNDIQVGLANSFNKFNFVGSGVTVDPVGFLPSDQTGIATIRINVIDVNGSGDVNSIQYKASNGFLGGALDFVYVSGRIGIGTTQPTTTLEIVGNMKVSGIITGTATTANNLSNAANITTGTISSSRLSGTYDVSITGTATTASNLTADVNINTSGIISASSFVGNLTGTATTASGLTANININTSGIVTASKFYGDLYGNLSSVGTLFDTIIVSGISTFTSGPVLVGTTTATGTATQRLQVTGGAYVSGNLGIGITNTSNKLEVIGGDVRFATASQGDIQITHDNLVSTIKGGSTTQLALGGNGAEVVRINSTSVGIGTTNPLTPLQVETYGIKTGVGTFDASVGVSTTIDSFSVSSTNFKTSEYTVHISFGSSIQAQKVLVMQDQTTAYAEEYAVMYNNSLLVSIGATISGGNCILQATPQTGISGLTTYRFARNTLL